MLDEMQGAEPEVRQKYRELLDRELNAPLATAEREAHDTSGDDLAVEELERLFADPAYGA